MARYKFPTAMAEDDAIVAQAPRDTAVALMVQTDSDNDAGAVLELEMSMNADVWTGLAAVDPADGTTAVTNFTGPDKFGVVPTLGMAGAFFRLIRTDANGGPCNAVLSTVSVAR